MIKKNFYASLSLLVALLLLNIGSVSAATSTGTNDVLQDSYVIDPALPVPTNLQALTREKHETEAAFSWVLPAAAGVQNILIYRNGLYHKRYPITELDNQQFIDDYLNPETEYTYQLRTEGADGLVSALSNPLLVVTGSFGAKPPPSIRAYTRSFDMSYLNLTPYDCSADADNTGVTEFGKLFYGQTHLFEPTPANKKFTHRLDGSKLPKRSQEYKTGVTDGRPLLVQLQATGSGAPNAVRVEIFNRSTKVGEVCMQPPQQLFATQATVGSGINSQALEHTYHAYIMPEWVRPGLSLRLSGIGYERTVPANMIRIEPPTLYHVFDVHAESKGAINNKNPGKVLRLARYKQTKAGQAFRSGYNWHAQHPSKDMILTSFPIILEAQPYRHPKRSLLTELGYLGRAISYKNWGNSPAGVSCIGCGRASGGLPVAGHELGHATGIGHIGGKDFYPYSPAHIDKTVIPVPQHHQPMLFNSYHNIVQQYQTKNKKQRVGGPSDYFNRITNRNLTRWPRWDSNVKIPTKYQAIAGRERGAWVKWNKKAWQYTVNPAQFSFNNVLPKQQDVQVISYTGIYNEWGNLDNLQQRGIDISTAPEELLASQRNAKVKADFFYRNKGDLGILHHPVYYSGNYKYADNGDARSDSFLNQLRNTRGTLCSNKGCNVIARVEFEDGTDVVRLLEQPLLRNKNNPQTGGIAQPYPFFFSTLDHGSKVARYELRELSAPIYNHKFRKVKKITDTHLYHLNNDGVRDLIANSKLLITETDFTTDFLPKSEWNFTQAINVNDADFDQKAYEPEFRRKMFLPRRLALPPSDFLDPIHQNSKNKDRIKPEYLRPVAAKFKSWQEQQKAEELKQLNAIETNTHSQE